MKGTTLVVLWTFEWVRERVRVHATFDQYLNPPRCTQSRYSALTSNWEHGYMIRIWYRPL